MAFGSTNTNGHLAAELDAHTEDKGNPHGVTAEQAGAAPAKHTHTPEEVGLSDINDQAPTYGEAGALAPLTPGEKMSAAFGKIAKAIKDLIAHIGNKNNPHGVTAGQAGAAPANHKHTASDVGAAPSDHTHSGMVTIGGDGVTELGRYLDFHETVGNGHDYDARLDCGTGTGRIFTLPKTGGELMVAGSGGVVRLDSGTYLGTGAYGSKHPNSLTFSIKPWLVFVTDPNHGRYVLFMRPAVTTYPVAPNTTSVVTVSWSEKGVTWYVDNIISNEAICQFNAESTEYCYIVIGI